MQVYLALDDDNEVIGYYCNGQVYATYGSLPIKRGLFSRDCIEMIADIVYQNGQLISLAAKHEQAIRKARLLAQLEDLTDNDAFSRLLRGY